MARAVLGRGGMLLIGVDTKKNEVLLNAAYNDAAGVTAQFNLNLLHRVRRELDADLQPKAFEHRAFYNAQVGRIEMHLISTCAQTLRLNGHRFELMAGESIHTENSYKYALDEVLALASSRGFSEVRH